MQPASIPQDSETLPFDFLTYLERQLGVSREAAQKMLGEWLLSYQPLPCPVRPNALLGGQPMVPDGPTSKRARS